MSSKPDQAQAKPPDNRVDREADGDAMAGLPEQAGELVDAALTPTAAIPEV